jgi:hypothetical protein
MRKLIVPYSANIWGESCYPSVSNNMEIKNTSKTPIKVPLPGGKNLFLGIGVTGKVSAFDLEGRMFDVLTLKKPR